MIAYVTLGAAVTCVAFGQLNFKLFGTERHLRYLVAALTLFVFAQICFFLALLDIRVGIVYLSTALTQILVLVLSRLVLHENLTRHHGVAMVFILSGLALYAL